MIKKWAMLAGFALLMSPAAARADWLFTPQIGSTFGHGDAGFSYGASIGYVGASNWGFEFEFGATPGVLGGNINDAIDEGLLRADFDRDLLDDRGSSYMFNAVYGGPHRGANNAFRPYFSGGFGWIRAVVESDTLLFDDEISNTNFGFNAGGGVATFFKNVGIRGDVRYYQTLTGGDFNDVLDIEVGDVDFWRATGGVVFRW